MISYVPKEDAIRRWPEFNGDTLLEPPASREEVERVFGRPYLVDYDGKPLSRVDSKWEKKNIVICQGDAAMPGVPNHYHFPVHRLLEARMREAFRRAQVVCPGHRIAKAWAFNFRHIRHDFRRPLSLHCWCAVDVNPDENSAVTFKRGKAPEHFSQAWYKVWPRGLPQEFVDAFLSLGFTWGGDWDRDDKPDESFVDPMHFQFATCG